jgi:acyl-CoA synthetase (AMP-forming)/AMP-acid ligase II
MNTFWIDSKLNIAVSYDVLYQKLVEKGSNNTYIKSENPFELYLALLRNLINGKDCTILDADFSDEELVGLGVDSEQIENSVYVQADLETTFSDFEQILYFLAAQEQMTTVQIFTSGTTGRPKKVAQTLNNLTRAVKVDLKYQSHIWAFAYNPSHFAGLQVFFQALYNQNKIVYSFGNTYNSIYEDILNHKLTHLSCTPTFIKMLLPYIEVPIDSLVSLTFGGEKFDKKVQDSIRLSFPNALIKNVYASTEAGSLLRSNGEYFNIPERYRHEIKIVDNEMIIHRNLLGNSDNFVLVEGWYHTGDIIEFKDELNQEFKFKSRKSEMINVGGYKVNPEEIENIIKVIPGIKDAIVFGRKNSIMCNIIEVNVIKEQSLEDSAVKAAVKAATSVLQDFKRPRIIKFVDQFELTRTGKVKKI